MKARLGIVIALLAVLLGGLYIRRDDARLWLGQKLRPVFEPALRAEMDRASKNLDFARNRLAADEAARFVNEHMPSLRRFKDRFGLLRHSLESVQTEGPGLYCEFGVFEGESINFIASLTNETIHGFDSFEGLPETWRNNFPKGTFEVDQLPQVRSNVILHKGWFEDSLSVFKRERPEPIVFAHMDADLYSATKTVFDLLGESFVPGSVIQFDEFFNFPGWKSGEYQAFMKFIDERDVEFEYLGFCGGAGQQVAVRILQIGETE